MADKIVILEDENGNNIYPITRGLAADSVDTNAIQDGAVTSSKIDSTTLYSNASGQGLGPFTLSDSIQNYSKIEVEFRDSDGDQGLTTFKVITGTNKTLITTFQPGWSSDKTYYIKSALVSFTGTSASIDACKEGGMPNGSSPTVGVDSSTIIKIYSVVGYK